MGKTIADIKLTSNILLDVYQITIDKNMYYISDDNIVYLSVLTKINNNKNIIIGREIGYIKDNIIFINKID